jgi:HAD superfamily hydrolase (TIGR01509 family)
MPSRRPVLLFDVMDTLVEEPFWRAMPAFFGLTLEELLAVKHPTAWVEFELGQIEEQEFLARFFRDGRAFDRAAFLAAVHGAYRWLDGMEALLGELGRAGFALHALSNYPRWYQAIEARLGLGRYLAWSFVSCDTGLRKPDPESFLQAARQLGLAPGECLLVDDREENCAAARALGLQALPFRGAAELRAELVRRGLLSAMMAP